MKKISKRKKISAEEEIKKANRIAQNDPVNLGKSKIQRTTTEIMLALLGAVVGSFSTVCIMLPNDLTYGGITGLAKLVQSIIGLNYSIAYYIFSGLIILFVLITLGFREVRKIILLSIAYPTFMLVFQMLHIELKFPDIFLASVFCGVAFGISNGLTFHAGFSSGGTDSVAKVIKLKKLPYKGINQITTVINVAIVILSSFVLGIYVGMYALVTMYISMKVSEAVMFGFTEKLLQLEILTNNPEALIDYVMNEMGRGVSSNTIVGEYTREKKKQLRVICSPRESFLIKKFIANNDPKAFVSVIQINSVWGLGRGFSNIKDDM